MAVIFLQENLNIRAWCGILLTILGVAWVLAERVPEQNQLSPTYLWSGIGFGFLSVMTNATGSILSRAAFANANIDPLWAALLRLSAAVFIILMWTYFPKRRDSKFSDPDWKSTRVMFACLFAAFCGTFLGIWLQQIAIKLTSAGIATTLLQTSPLFVIPIGIGMGEKVSWRAFFGVMMAIAGIALLFYWK